MGCLEASRYFDYRALNRVLDLVSATAHRLQANLDAAATTMVLEDLLPADIAAALTQEARQKAAFTTGGVHGSSVEGSQHPRPSTQHGSGDPRSPAERLPAREERPSVSPVPGKVLVLLCAPPARLAEAPLPALEHLGRGVSRCRVGKGSSQPP